MPHQTTAGSPAEQRACQAAPDTDTGTVNRGGPPANLESVLLGLARADNRTAYATDHRLALRNDDVRAIVELREGATLPTEFDLSVETRHENLVRAFVPVCDLVALSGHENISFVRSPQRAVPLDPSTVDSES